MRSACILHNIAITHFNFKEATMDMAELAKLPLAQRIEAMEVLWDSLTHDDAYDPSPAWHADLLADRVREIEDGKTMPWNEAKALIFATAAQIKQARPRV
jgi:hypothetical protein